MFIRHPGEAGRRRGMAAADERYLLPILLIVLSVLELVLIQDLEQGDVRAYLANLSYGQIGTAIGVISGGVVVGLIAFLVLSYLNVKIAKLDDIYSEVALC